MRKLFTICCLLLSLSAFAQPISSINLKALGATGDSAQLVTHLLQQALDSAHAQGGGTVYVPPGNYKIGTIQLKDYTTLYLEAGATLYASLEEKDYTVYNYWKRPILIYADRARHISIQGKGVINGRARRTYDPLKKVDYFIADYTEKAREAGVEMKMYYKVPPFVRLITFERSQDILLEGISLVESCSWTVDLKTCDRVNIRGLHITSSLEAGVNADGIDVDGCRDVRISDCVIETGDDAIAIKSNKMPWGYRSSENVTVTNCVLTSTSTALKLGTESYGDMRHIVFNNCVIRNSNRGLSIVVRYGGTVEDVIFSNITIETNRKHFNWWGNGEAIWVVLKKRGKHPVGQIRNVLFENIIATGQGSSKIEGYWPTEEFPDGKYLENIRLRNVQLHLEPEATPDKRITHGLEIHHVDGVHLSDVSVRWDQDSSESTWSSGVYLHEVQNVLAQGVTASPGIKGGDHPAFHLHQVRQAVLSGIYPGIGTKTGILFSGEKSKALHIQGFDPLGNCSEAWEKTETFPNNALQVKP
ncbi:MAG: glycosyl hydrolase family 28 protein [Bacteroidota bacterium]